MQHIRGLQTPTEALQHVFRLSLNASRPERPARLLTASAAGNSRYQSASAFKYSRSPQKTRPFLRDLKPARRPEFETRETDISQYGPKVDRPQKDLPRFHLPETPAFAYLRQPDGKLSERLPYQAILDMRQKDDAGRYKQFIHELAAPDAERSFPIVQLMSWKEAKAREQARKKAAKASKTIEKSLEMSWSIDEHDLSHRLGRLKDFLEKGAKVDVVVGSKRLKGWRRKKPVSLQEAEELVQRIHQTAMDVEGTKERMERKGKCLDTVNLFYQGHAKDNVSNIQAEKADESSGEV